MKNKSLIALIASCVLAAALVGCGGGSSSSAPSKAEPKDYAQIIHDARTDELNEYSMIVRPGEGEGVFSAIDGYSAEYEADMLNDEVSGMVLPMLGLNEGDYEDFAASVSMMMTQSYGVAIVKPASGKTEEVKAALEAFVEGQRSAMEHYLPDQYEIAKEATVTVMPSGEVVLVCSENGADVLNAIQKALA